MKRPVVAIVWYEKPMESVRRAVDLSGGSGENVARAGKQGEHRSDNTEKQKLTLHNFSSLMTLVTPAPQ